MNITILIESIVGLMVVLAVLLFFFLYVPKHKNTPKKQRRYTTPVEEKPKVEDFNTLVRIIKRKESSTQELQEALDKILEYYGEIPAKMGLRLHDDFYRYSEIILRLCRHESTNKDLIIGFYKGLLRKNPQYAKEIDDSLTKGLSSLGV